MFDAVARVRAGVGVHSFLVGIDDQVYRCIPDAVHADLPAGIVQDPDDLFELGFVPGGFVPGGAFIGLGGSRR